MNLDEITISEIQQLAIDIFNDDDTVEAVFGGSGGGGKSVIIGMLAFLRCKQYPGVREGIGRKDLSQLKKTTLTTLLGKVHEIMGVQKSDFHIDQSGTINYRNGSQIIPIELDYYPSDPDFNRLGSLEITDMFIDEVGEIMEASYNAIRSRIGRWLNDKYNITSKLICTCNPSQNFIRQYYYDKYKQLGGGPSQRWQNGYTKKDGNKIPAYSCFIRSSVYDNPFIEEGYIENLKRLPDKERKRILDGNWNYADDENSLFASTLLDKATWFNKPEPSEKFKKFIGVDVSDKGGDKTIFTLIDNGYVVTQKASNIQLNWNSKSELPISRLIADELIDFAQRNGFTPQFARHIAIECNGVGAACRDAMKERGWYFTEYIATNKSRSQGYYQMMLDFDSGELKLMHGLLGLDELRKQLTAHTYEMNNQEPSVVKKEKLKQVLGHSPDEADSLMIANYCRNLISNPQNDPKRNVNRILY